MHSTYIGVFCGKLMTSSTKHDVDLQLMFGRNSTGSQLMFWFIFRSNKFQNVNLFGQIRDVQCIEHKTRHSHTHTNIQYLYVSTPVVSSLVRCIQSKHSMNVIYVRAYRLKCFSNTRHTHKNTNTFVFKRHRERKHIAHSTQCCIKLNKTKINYNHYITLFEQSEHAI